MYSDKFVDKTLEKMRQMEEKANQNILDTPSCLKCDGETLWYGGKPRLSPVKREEIKKYYKQFRDLSYTSGFWYGFALAAGTNFDEEN